MGIKDFFYPWVPMWLRFLAIFIVLFTTLAANGVYLGNSTDMYSSLGVYEEPYTEAYNAVYVGMACGLMMELRLKLRFSNKTLLLWGLSVMLLMNVICAFTDNPAVVVAACLVLGFCKMSAFIEVLLVWLFIWSKKMDRSRLYPFLYITALPGIYFVTWGMSKLANSYNWRYAYIAALILVMASLLLALLLVKNHPIKRILPLYQMDWLGLWLLLSLLLLINYVSVYAKVEDWLESTRIRGALILIPVTLLAFILREMKVKRPLLPLRMFRSGRFVKGLFFFIVLGIFIPSTIQSLFSGGVLHFETFRNTELNLYMIPGVAVGAVVCYLWYYYKYDPDVLLFVGFLAYGLYYYMLYQKLATGVGLEDFWVPSLFRGFALIILYIVIGLYTVAPFKLEYVFRAAGMMLLFRSFLGSAIFTGLYSYLLYAGRVRHIDRIAGLAATTIPEAAARTGLSFRTISQQASLSASKELTGAILIAAAVLLAGIALSMLFRSLTTKDRIFNQ